ncbi:MAG: hypothetical protein KC731_41275, partial [Myxococcales bacterium]|nr:hypothetical protein [Myxococcales bacterium]
MTMLSSPRFLTLLLVPTFAVAACLGADLEQAASPESEATPTSPAPPADNGGGGASSGGGTKKDDCKPPDKPIDPSSLLPCPSYLCQEGGAHCVPVGLVPPDQVDMLGWCNKDQICVPDKLIASNATLIPKTCSAVMGLEGRCTSSCIPMVADSSDLLDQDSCDVGELCVPCYDPITLEPTGACDLPCDTGPVEPAPA